jgi:hypothetical protein
MFKICVLSLACLTGMISAAPIAKTEVTDQVMWHLQGARGFWKGYNTAFYKGKSKNDLCLNDEAMTSI